MVLTTGHPPLLLVEMGQAHEGSLNLAKSFIDLTAASGAGAIKVQIHLPEHESSRYENFRAPALAEDKNRLEFWSRTSFSPKQWEDLREHSKQHGLLFVASAFSKEAVDMCEDLGCDALKIGSAESLQNWFLEYAAGKNLPIIASTGMSSWQEIEATVSVLRDLDYFAIMQCTSLYPTPLESTLVGLIPELRKKFEIPVGYSDHSGEVSPSLFALALGAELIEVHGTFHSKIRGFDATSSLNFDQISAISQFRSHLESMRYATTTKDNLANDLTDLRSKFGRSAAARVDLSRGDILDQETIVFLKPGIGLDEGQIQSFIGRQLLRNVPSGEFLRIEDFET